MPTSTIFTLDAHLYFNVERLQGIKPSLSAENTARLLPSSGEPNFLAVAHERITRASTTARHRACSDKRCSPKLNETPGSYAYDPFRWLSVRSVRMHASLLLHYCVSPYRAGTQKKLVWSAVYAQSTGPMFLQSTMLSTSFSPASPGASDIRSPLIFPNLHSDLKSAK